MTCPAYQQALFDPPEIDIKDSFYCEYKLVRSRESGSGQVGQVWKSKRNY